MNQTITLILFLSLTCITPPNVPSKAIHSHTQASKYITLPCPHVNVTPVLQKPKIDLKSTAIGAGTVATFAFGFKFGVFGFFKWLAVRAWKLVRRRKDVIKLSVNVGDGYPVDKASKSFDTLIKKDMK